MLQTRISKEELSELPLKSFEGEIVVVDSLKKADEAVNYLSQFSIIGFDTETKPSFKKGQHNKVALLQLSTEEKAFLFKINKIGLPIGVSKLLSNPKIKKPGVAIRDDIRILRKIRDFKPAGFIELQTLAKEIGLENFSLKKLTGITLNFRISKSQQLSNWQAEQLSEAQKTYAATDAWTSLLVYKVLLESDHMEIDKNVSKE